MRSPDEVRPQLNRGKYLFFNPILRALVGAMDWLLSLRYGPAFSLDGIQPQRILVCMQAHIGDAILFSSVLPVLHAAYPQAELGALVHPGSANVLANNPHLTRVHTFTHFRLNRGARPLPFKLWEHWRNRRRVLEELRDSRYDLALDFYAYFPNSIPLLAASGIPIRLGWTSGGFGGLLTHASDWPDSPIERHVIEWHKTVMALLPACRLHLDLACPQLFSTDTERSEWAGIRVRSGIPADYVIFHVGAGADFKAWPEPRWHELAQLCLKRGLNLVLLGQGNGEIELCNRIVDGVRSAPLRGASDGAPVCVNVAGTLSWPVMSAAISHARLLVGLDSSAVHVAAAWGVPAVCVASGINGEAWRPYSPKAHVVVSPTPCSPCHLPAGCEGMECIRRTDASVVFARICIDL